MIQVVSDERGIPCQYILSGSQNFLMAKGIGQSLAGRVGMGTLLPLSFVEACSARDISPEEYVLQGGYPRLYDVNIPLATYFESYLATYVQRDVADYLDVRNLTAFRAFLGLCAGRVGSLLNVSSLASDAGVSYKTAHAWLSMLEASYVVYCLAPYTANLGKRLTKSPKIYFAIPDCFVISWASEAWESLCAVPCLGRSLRTSLSPIDLSAI